MTKRLEDALNRLTPEQVEQVTRFVESFTASTQGAVQCSVRRRLERCALAWSV